MFLATSCSSATCAITWPRAHLPAISLLAANSAHNFHLPPFITVLPRELSGRHLHPHPQCRDLYSVLFAWSPDRNSDRDTAQDIAFCIVSWHMTAHINIKCIILLLCVCGWSEGFAGRNHRGTLHCWPQHVRAASDTSRNILTKILGSQKIIAT